MPKRFKDLYGENLWDIKGLLAMTRDRRVIKAFSDYLESTVPLEKYDGNYLAPEIWLPQETQINKLAMIA